MVLQRIVAIQFHNKSNHLRLETFVCMSVTVRSSRLACFAAMLHYKNQTQLYQTQVTGKNLYWQEVGSFGNMFLLS